MKLSLLLEQKHHDIMQTKKMIPVDKAKSILKKYNVTLKVKPNEMKEKKAETDFDGKTIAFSNEFKDKMELDTLIHELGHVFYFRKKLEDDKLKASKEKISTYYDNKMERFAENFKFYFLSKEKLKDIVKEELGSILDDNIKNICVELIKSII